LPTAIKPPKQKRYAKQPIPGAKNNGVLKKYAAPLRLYFIETETASMMPATTTAMTITNQHYQRISRAADRLRERLYRRRGNKMEGFTVLLVDNEPTTSDRIYNGLSDQGLAIRRAQSQAQTLSEIEKKDIDVVLLDLMIAGTDGIALLREIKTRDPLVEVILLANQANPSVAIQGIKLGAFDFLFKSVDIDDLFHKLQDAYQKKAIQEEKIEKIRHFMDEDK